MRKCVSLLGWFSFVIGLHMKIYIPVDKSKKVPLTLKENDIQIGPYFFLSKEEAESALVSLSKRIKFQKEYYIQEIDYDSFMYLITFLDKNPKKPDLYSVLPQGTPFSFDSGRLVPLTEDGAFYISDKEDTDYWLDLMFTFQQPFFTKEYVKSILIKPSIFN